MFGYIRPLHPELKVREYELYRAVYCGLCRSMGRATGCLSRLTLSYDFVFLALFRAALAEPEDENNAFDCSYRRCFVHPLSKRLTAADSEVLSYCARANAVLTYRKVRDDIGDRKGLSKLPAAATLPAASYMKSRAVRRPKQLNSGAARSFDISSLDAVVAEKLATLSELERTRCESPDKAAEVFGELLSEVFACGLDGTDERLARQVGLHLGRWIYLCDAADDCVSDRKTGAYNPFLYSGLPDGDELRTSLRMELTGVASAIELIDFRDKAVESIIKNIIYLGMTEPIENRLIPPKAAVDKKSGSGDSDETGVHE